MTPAQREVFLVVDEWWKSFGYGPTVDEIMDRIGARGRGMFRGRLIGWLPWGF
jgi:SOS-response transcriptional repressor LexA